MTDEHLARLKYFPANRAGYPNQWTNEGYAETAVEWLSIRIRDGLEGKMDAEGHTEVATHHQNGENTADEGAKTQSSHKGKGKERVAPRTMPLKRAHGDGSIEDAVEGRPSKKTRER